MRRTIILDLTADAKLGKDLVVTGGVFAAGETFIKQDELCNVVLRAGQEELHLVARAVLINERGAGLEIVGRTSDLRNQIEAFVRIASYHAVMRDTRGMPSRAKGQDTIPSMPPRHEDSAPALPKGEIVERVRTSRYEDDQGASRTKTLTRTLADSEGERRRPAGSTPPDQRRVAAGSIPPATDRPPAPEVPVAYAPTQRADSLNEKALAARIRAAKREAEADAEKERDKK
jgi:hypothetical protein